MDDFLSKPIEPKTLNAILLKWLPADKMIVIDEEESAPKEGSGYDELLSELEGVEELDVRKGIAGVGGEKHIYVDILRQAYMEIGGYIDEIKKFRDEENWKEYSIRIHAVKSVFANIGIDRLSKWAYELETASRNGDTGRCVRETDEICAEMADFRDALMRTRLMREEEAEKTPMDAASIAQKLKDLKEACLDGKSYEAEDIASELAKAAFDEKTEDKLREIRLLVRSFDYEQAEELASALLDHLKNLYK